GGVSRGLRVRRVVHRLLADRRGQRSNLGPGGTAAGRAALGSPHRAAHGLERIGGPGRGPGGAGDPLGDGAVLSCPPTTREGSARDGRAWLTLFEERQQAHEREDFLEALLFG